MRLWLLWTLATSAASLIVFTLPYWLAAVLFGAAVGAAQWLLLRNRIARANWWLPITVIAWPLGLGASYVVHAVGQAAGIAHLATAVYCTAAGAVVGVMQWLIVRRGRWIFLNAVGWGIGFAAGLSISRGLAGGAISGAIGGAITGMGLAQFLAVSGRTDAKPQSTRDPAESH